MAHYDTVWYITHSHNVAVIKENPVQQGDFDVFNALDLMENTSFLEKLKFGIGDGNLQYYLYNWKCPAMIPKKIGLVLQ